MEDKRAHCFVHQPGFSLETSQSVSRRIVRQKSKIEESRQCSNLLHSFQHYHWHPPNGFGRSTLKDCSRTLIFVADVALLHQWSKYVEHDSLFRKIAPYVPKNSLTITRARMALISREVRLIANDRPSKNSLYCCRNVVAP